MLNETLRVIINQIAPLVAAGVIEILVKDANPAEDALISLLRKREEAVAAKIWTDKYNSNLVIAKNIYKIVDEEFRITPILTNTFEAAQAMFEEKLF